MNFGEAAALIAIVLNLGTLVWSAGKLKGATDYIQKAVNDLDDVVSEHERRISFLEGVHSVQKNFSHRSEL